MGMKNVYSLVILLGAANVAVYARKPTTSELINLMKVINGRITSLHELVKMKDTRVTNDLTILQHNLTEEIRIRSELEARVSNINPCPNCQQTYDLANWANQNITALKAQVNEATQSRKSIEEDVDELWSIMSSVFGENGGDVSLTDIQNDLNNMKTEINTMKNQNPTAQIQNLSRLLELEKAKLNTLAREVEYLKSQGRTSCEEGKVLTENGDCRCPDGKAGERCERYIRDCTEGQALGMRNTGLYMIQPSGSPRPFMVKCYMNEIYGGWTIIQMRRSMFQESCAMDFNRNWNDYKIGFGVPGCDFWIGNDHLHQLTQQGNYTLDVSAQIMYVGRMGHSKYSNFRVGSEAEQYAVNYDNYIVDNARDGFGSVIKGRRFSTPDHGQSICTLTSPSGWWFDENCTSKNLNTPRYGVFTTKYQFAQPLQWVYMDGVQTLDYTSMFLKAESYKSAQIGSK